MQPMAGLPAMYLLRAASCTHPLQSWGVSHGRTLSHSSPALRAPKVSPWSPGARAEATGVAAHALVRFPATVLAAGAPRRSAAEPTGVTLPSAARRRSPVCAAATAESPTAQKAAPSLGTEVSLPVRQHACRTLCTRRRGPHRSARAGPRAVCAVADRLPARRRRPHSLVQLPVREERWRQDDSEARALVPGRRTGGRAAARQRALTACAGAGSRTLTRPGRHGSRRTLCWRT